MALLILLLFAAVSPAFSYFRPGNCSEAYVICDKLATCIEDKAAYSFVCECQKGTIGDGFQSGTGCTFTKEPCSNDDPCQPNGFCSGGFCECYPFYQGNGVECLDIDECLSNPCDPNANCKNNFGAPYTCTCKSGYKGDGLTCTRTCIVDDDCTDFAKCYVDSCKCNAGFTGDGFVNCEDINECLSNPCDPNANCKNNIGPPYMCTCKGGYKGDGLTCTKTCSVDEDCTDFAKCDGDKCKCNAGYTGDGFVNCEALPLNCSLYTKYQDLSDGDCVGEPVPVGECEGGCGIINPDKCCKPDKTEMYAYSLTCANGTTLQRQKLSALSCKCDDLVKG